jgi:hypothetical protein
VTGVYKVKNTQLKELHARVLALTAGISNIRFEAIRREKNKRADELSNIGMDKEK